MSTPQQHRLIGQVIAERYRVVELLAEGGMGAVYIAEHLTLQKQVALKIVHPEHAGNAELAARFAREAMATSRIDHPNVISALDFGTLDDGSAFLAVQLVRGPSLSRVLTEQGGLPWPRVASIGAQIADALCAAHGQGIVHRDLKPDNVLLQGRDDGGELVKVLDFGVAKFAPESQVPLSVRTDVTQVGMVVGTPGYMAPEQTIGSPADDRSDLYSLGVMLWESLVGRPLWSAPDLQALVERQMSETPTPVRIAADDTSIPEPFELLIASLLARRAEDRPADASIVRDALRRISAASGEVVPFQTGERPAPQRPSLHSLRPSPVRASAWPESAAGATPPLPLARRSPSPLPPVIPLPVHAPTSPVDPEASTPELAPRPRRRRASRTAWALVALLLVVIALPLYLIATGRLELRPTGDMAVVAERVRELASAPEVEETDEGAVAEQPVPDPAVPTAVAPALSKLLSGGSREQRVRGAEQLLAYRPEGDVPLYVRHMALLQRAATCNEKREQLEQLALLGEPRALPLLRWLSARPKAGCGRRKREDCLGCLRKPLGELLRKLSDLTP